jgi:hypothetical protein
MLREIIENSTTAETNESLKNAFDRIVALPLRSGINPNKSIKDVNLRDNNTARSDRTLTSYEKYSICLVKNIYKFSVFRHRLLVEAGRLSLLLCYTDLTKVILDALANIRLKVKRNKSNF